MFFILKLVWSFKIREEQMGLTTKYSTTNVNSVEIDQKSSKAQYRRKRVLIKERTNNKLKIPLQLLRKRRPQ